jgi:DNA-directed RNA polymerase subunit omega
MSEKLNGIVSPSIDHLLNKEFDGEKVSKYELVIFAAKRARQINDYYSALHEGSLFNNVGPLVETTIEEKPLTIAMHEIDQDKLSLTRPAAE